VFPICELNVEPQDYYYADGVIVHNVSCLGTLWKVANTYALYDEVFWPEAMETCHFYSAMSGNTGNAPSYGTVKGNVTSCQSSGAWTSKGLCDSVA